jgi:branched-chain amino acid transport system ATP-binding protein
MSQSPAPALRLEDATRDYGGLRAVDQVSLAVLPGERRAIIGPNGAGKTTLFKLISREERLTRGRVELLGQDVTRLPAHRVARMGLGRTYQITRVFPALPVQDNVVLAALGARGGKFQMLRTMRSRRDIVEVAREAIVQAGLEEVAKVRAAELGHGQQRQLELALALATDPKVLLLDEPGAGLATAERARMRELVHGLPEQLTLLLIEHDMELALGLADHVTCMHDGKVVAEGTPDEIKQDRHVQDLYLGRASR